jgi:putative CocE/NonD family hydrolase
MIELLNYPAFAEYADPFNFKDRYKNVNAPALMVSGWFDMFLKGQLEDFVSMREMAPGDAGKYTKLTIGPWGHVVGRHPDAGKDAKLSDMMRLFMNFDWYDRWLRGEMNGVEDGAPLRIYVMGKNEWRDENEWPLARTEYTKYYIHSNGDANTKDGDGTLSTEAPSTNEPPDKFKYDPMDPVITVGGNNLLESVGALDQKDVETRDDVLVFTGEPLDADLEITGWVTATIYAASSAVDTDFTVKVCDVYPNGKSLNIVDGIIRARYRESLTDPSLIEPGRIYKYEIDLWATSLAFLKGHRIRVQVSSSNFPRFDRNGNLGGEGGPDDYVKAKQKIYHDQDHPSHVTLPVIP